jgi:hypothetical protein
MNCDLLQRSTDGASLHKKFYYEGFPQLTQKDRRPLWQAAKKKVVKKAVKKSPAMKTASKAKKKAPAKKK